MRRRQWTEELIESELLKCIKILGLERMPTREELIRIGRNDLHIKISRTKKYRGWAEYLSIPLKSSCTLEGQICEDYVEAMLIRMGHKVESMSTKFPYDLLVNDSVKIDVKKANPYMLKGSRVHAFGISKKSPTCDIYICLAYDEKDEIERLLVIPSHLLRVRTLCIGKESKYNEFINRWDLIGEYTSFFSTIQSEFNAR